MTSPNGDIGIVLEERNGPTEVAAVQCNAGPARSATFRSRRPLQHYSRRSLTTAQYKAWRLSEMESELVLYDLTARSVHAPDWLLKLDHWSWHAHLDAVLQSEGEEFQRKVDAQLQDNTVLGMIEVVFELYTDNIVGQLGNVDMALLWILSQNTFTEFCIEHLVSNLLQRNAQITTAIKDTLNTPLHLAAIAGLENVTRSLLEHKVAPVTAINRNDKCALELAIAGGHNSVATLLVQHMEPPVVRQLFLGNRLVPSKLSLPRLIEKPCMESTVTAVLDTMVEPLLGFGNKCIIHYTILDADKCGRPPSDPYFNKNEKSALHTIAMSNNKVIIEGLRAKELVSQDVVRLLLRRKWKSFAKYLFILKFIYFIITFCALGVAFTLATAENDPRVYDDGVDVFRLICEAVALVSIIINGASEIIQMRVHRWDYLKDVKNYLDIGAIACTLLVIPFRIADSESQWFFASLAFLTNSIRAFEYTAVFRTTGTYVGILRETLWRDMIPFLVIFSVILCSFSGARFLASGGNIYTNDLATSCDDDDGDASGENATDSEEVELLHLRDLFIQGVNVMLEASSTDETTSGGMFYWLERFLYHLYLFIVLTVLLNLLIAQMTDTYANVQGNAQRSLNLSRAWIVARFEHNARFIVDFRKRYYESSEIIENPKELLQRWEVPPVGEVNAGLEKGAREIMNQREALEQLKNTLLHKLHEQSEQLTKLRELVVSMSKQGGAAGMQKPPDNS